MLIRLGYDIRFDVPFGASFVALLRVHPSRQPDLDLPDLVRPHPRAAVEHFKDCFGNLAARFVAPPGSVTLQGSFTIWDTGEPDPIDTAAHEMDVSKLPLETLPYLLNSRYCEVDLLSSVAWKLFGTHPAGWLRVQAICDWVSQHITFDYSQARATKSAWEVYLERAGVCRDFQHLAITLCRALNIPARYAAGYLGDIGVPAAPYPMDFSAWFQAYLGGQWRTFDARHNQPRIGRVLIATGRDATDVAITTTFGKALLRNFTVVAEEIDSSVCGAASDDAAATIPRNAVSHAIVESDGGS